MNALIHFFYIILYQPLLNALILLYIYLPGHDFGIAVIVFTLIIRLILSPSSLKAIKSQKALSSLQPKIKEVQNKYKNDKQGLAKETMKLYQKEKINPFSGCLPLLFQLPILIALYQIFLKGLGQEALATSLYGFVSNPGIINLTFLGIINLSQSNIYLALITGICQFFQSKMSMGKPRGSAGKGDFSSMMQNQMLYFFPILTVFIVWKLGSLIGLYWLVSTLFSIGEQYVVRKRMKLAKT